MFHNTWSCSPAKQEPYPPPTICLFIETVLVPKYYWTFLSKRKTRNGKQRDERFRPHCGISIVLDCRLTKQIRGIIWGKYPLAFLILFLSFSTSIQFWSMALLNNPGLFPPQCLVQNLGNFTQKGQGGFSAIDPSSFLSTIYWILSIETPLIKFTINAPPTIPLTTLEPIRPKSLWDMQECSTDLHSCIQKQRLRTGLLYCLFKRYTAFFKYKNCLT